jgi:hypothetical protein
MGKHRSDSFPGLKTCMKMMTSRDAETSEAGFHWLLPHAGEYVDQLIEAYESGDSSISAYWLLELIVAANSADTLPFLTQQLSHPESYFRRLAAQGIQRLGSPEVKQVLWKARSTYIFDTPAATQEFQNMLDELMGWQIKSKSQKKISK